MEENTKKKKKWPKVLLIIIAIFIVLIIALGNQINKGVEKTNLEYLKTFEEDAKELDGIEDAWGEANDDGTYTVYVITVRDYIRYKCSYTYNTITDEQTQKEIGNLNHYDWEPIGTATEEYLNDVNDLANDIVDQAGQIVGQ